MTDAERLEDCGECGQRVGIAERHTFVDCALYAVNHRGSLALPGKYERALVAEVGRLRGVVGAIEMWAIVNEIAPVPLDWRGLGAILHPELEGEK